MPSSAAVEIDLAEVASPLELAVLELRQAISRLDESAGLPWWESPVLTTERAMEYVGIRSRSVFYRRMADWGLSQCDSGMWPRMRIDAAMKRISRQHYKSTRGRKRA